MEVSQVYGNTFSSFWKIDVEDNAFFNLKFGPDVIAQCHVSWTNWKNIFSFEIFGINGYIKIEGLGGNYGKETLEIGYRQPTGGAPQIEHFEFDENDNFIIYGLDADLIMLSMASKLDNILTLSEVFKSETCKE